MLEPAPDSKLAEAVTYAKNQKGSLTRSLGCLLTRAVIEHLQITA